MDSSVKRIGDVTIERVISDKKDVISRGEKTMHSESDSDSESLSSEEDLLLTEGSPSIQLDSKSVVQNLQASVNLTSSKRKNDFESESSQAKKVKNQLDPGCGESDSEINTVNSEISPSVNQNTVSDTNVDQTLIATSLQSENEDSEYDSDDESDMEDATQKLDDRVPILDSEKSDFIEKLASSLGETSSQKSDEKIDSSDYDYDITEKLKEMGEISVETVKKGEKPRKIENPDTPESEISLTPAKKDSGSDSEDKNSSERKIGNMRRNIREVMDETQLDEATLAAQRQEMERLRRVQEQQKIIREVQRQIALNRQNNKTQHRVISLLQGNNSIIKQMPGTSGTTANRIGGTVLVKLPNGETKPMTRITKGQTPFELVRLQKGAVQGKVGKNFVPVKKTAGGNLTPSVSIAPVAKKIEPKTGSDSEEETSDSEKKMRKVAGKPKDVVTISSSSDDDCIVLSEDEAEEPEPEEDPCNSGMHTNDAYNVPDEQGRVLINVGHPENESDIHLAPQIARVIKPHQIGGVRFLYDNVIESIDRFSTSTGFGCILAHSMGLGKTLQVVCFSDIFLRHTPAKTILCIMPINTLQNWMAEFNMWLPKDIANSPLLSHGEVRPRNFNLFVLNDSHKTLAARAKVIQEWHKDGGVLLIGYELYRLLSLRRNPKSKSKRNKKANPTPDPETPEDEEKNKSLFEEIHEALVKPGPDLVICDEGHRIKNSHASISQALKQIRSKRRIVLTGYPLQNNLLEYWCMVDFVRPNYLGTKTEFSNMFERPIQNGQCIDSTPQDIRLMRYRAHVLHSLLEGFVQRRSHAVLQTSLPQKEEYVLLVRMTDFQRKLYDTFMNEVVRTKTVPNPLKAFAVCCKIWNHPDVLYYFLKKHTSGDAVDIDLEEVAGTTPGTTTTSTTPKKGSSRAKGGSKKEKKSAASKSNTSSPNSTKPAASVTPSTTTTTPPSSTTTSSSSGSAPPSVPPPMNVQNPSMSNPATPALPNPPNYHQPNQNYPMPPYPNSHLPYPHQNYGNYPNGDYYNQNYPNYNQHYYPNQDYSGFYDNTKQENYPGGYPPENQNYWNQGNQNQYYNQNNQEYYNNMPPGYDNQHYYRQNEYPAQSYGQNVYPAPNYGSNWPQPAPASDTYKPNPDFKPTEFSNSEFKPEEKMDKLKLDEPIEIDECKPAGENADDEKKSDSSVVEVKDESDEKQDKDGEMKGVDPSANLAKINSKEDPGIPYDWATELMKGYTPGCIENSAKMEIFFCILQESMALGDRILLFSQSLFTLNLIEEFLQKCEVPGSDDKWARNKHYYRLDGSTSALEREKLINEYNSNPNIHLFLVSTRAGSLGINLVGANRVIVFDASWNPCHDTQAVCRVYRYGQKKPCFVYRIVMDNCLEKKIYDRQINKQGMADRVVDECNPDAHLSMKDVTNLCWDDEKDSEVKDFSTNKDKYIDVVMQKVLDAYSSRLSKEPFQHESLLIDRKEKKLSQAEKRLAKRSYELEKQANINSRPAYSYYNNGTGQGLQIRAIRTQDGVLQNKPVASVRPMQSEQMVRDLNRPGSASPGRSRWIPAEVWQRQGMTAQEMTLPLDVVIPTNSPDRGSIVLKAGQKVLVLKSPKGIYMQLECGKIVAIKTAFKVRGGKAPEKGEEGNNKDSSPTTILKKVPQVPNSSKTPPATVPLPLKNNSAITVIPKAGQQRIVKPFTQSVTKLNMRSIRQPVPNLVGRQVPMRLNNPRFTGKIQSMNRKVQLAKAKPYNLDKIGDSPKPMDPSVIKMEPPDLDTETHVVQSSDEDIPMDGQVENADKKDDSSDSGRFGNNEIYSSSEKSMEATSDVERMSNNEYGEPGMHRRPSTDSFTSGGKVSDSYSNLEYPSDRYQNMDYPPTLDKYPAMDSYHSSRFNQSGNETYQNPPSLEKFGESPSYGAPPSGKYSNTYQPMETFQNVDYPKTEKYQNLDKPKRLSSTSKDDKSASGTGNDTNITEPPSPFSPSNSQNATNQLASGSAQYPPNSTGQSPQAPPQYNQLSPSSNQVPPSPNPNTPQPDASSNQNAPTTAPFLPSTNQFPPNTNQNQSAPAAPPPNQNPSHTPLTNHNQLPPHGNQIPPNTPQLTIPAPQPHPKEVDKVKPPTSFGMNPISNYNPSNYSAPIYQSTASQPPASVQQNLPANTSFNQSGANLHQNQPPSNLHNQTNLHQGNMHQQASNLHQNPSNFHQNSNVHQNSTNLHQNSSNMHQNVTNMQHNPASHQNAPGMHQNAATPQPNTGTGNLHQPQSNLQQNSANPQQNSTNLHQSPASLHQNPSNVNLHQNSPNMHSNTSNLHQNPSNVHQNPSNVHQNPSNVHQNPSNVHQNPSNVHQNPSNVHQNPSNVHQNPPNLHQNPTNLHQNPSSLHPNQPNLLPSGTNVHQNTSNLHQNPSNMHQNPAGVHPNTSNVHQSTSNLHQNTSNAHQNTQNLHQNTTNLHQNTSNMHQNTSNMHQSGSNLHQNTSNVHQNQPNLLQNQGNMHQNTGNLHQNTSNMHQNQQNLHQNTGNLHQGASNVHSNTQNMHQSTSNLHQNTSNMHQNTGNMHPNTSNMHQNNTNLHQNNSNTQQASNMHPNTTNLHQNTGNMHTSATNLQQPTNLHQNTSNLHSSTGLHQSPPNLQQNAGGMHQNMLPNTMNLHQQNIHQSLPTTHQNVHGGGTTHPGPTSNLNIHQTNPNMHQGTTLHQSSANATNMHQTSPTLTQNTSSIRQVNTTPVSSHAATTLASSNHPNTVQAPSSGQNLQSYQSAPIVSQSGNTGSNLHHQSGTNMHPSGAALQPVGSGGAPHSTYQSHLHSSNHGAPPPAPPSGNLHQLGHQPSNPHQNVHLHQPISAPHPAPNLHQNIHPAPNPPPVQPPQPSQPAPTNTSTSGPQPSQTSTNPPPVEQGNTNRSLKNYRHNFASQKNHGNFAASKGHKPATSSALHQLEQATSAIGENKQAFQESLDSITNSYGAVPPTDTNKPEETHIIDLDNDKIEEIPEKTPKTSLKPNQPASGEKQTTAQPPATPNTKPETIQQPLPQPQDYGYGGYYGYNPHLQGYPQAQPLIPPQNYYGAPEPQLFNEQKQKTDKPLASTSTTTSTTTTTTNSTTTTDSTVPSNHASYTSAPTGFGHYAQPGLPPPPPHPHGAYDMMYPQQNQYSSTYPGLPYPNQPYAPYQPTYETPPQGNMYSAFHRPDLPPPHAYADPYGGAPYMRAGYPLPAPPPTTVAGAPAPPPPATGAPPPAHPQYAPYGAQYPPPPPPPPGYDYQYGAHPPAPPFVTGLN